MRKLMLFAAALLVAAAATAGTKTGQTATQTPEPTSASTGKSESAAPSAGKLESLEDRVSYILGFNLGHSLKANEVQVNQDLIVQGLQAGLKGELPLLTDAEIQTTMQTLQQQVAKQKEERNKALGVTNQAAAEAFLAQNKQRKEVKTTASGLQYEVLKEGTGPSPKATDTVTVHYTGTLIDGTKFDSSVDRGQPATFGLNKVISGWTEGLQLMKVGSKYKLYVPAAMGYGERGGPGGKIGPNALLIFEIELLAVKPAEAPKPEEKPPGGQ